MHIYIYIYIYICIYVWMHMYISILHISTWMYIWHVWLYLCMTHIPHKNQSWHTYEWVTSHTWLSQCTIRKTEAVNPRETLLFHIHQQYHTHEQVMSHTHINIHTHIQSTQYWNSQFKKGVRSHVTRITVSCVTYIHTDTHRTQHGSDQFKQKKALLSRKGALVH